MTDSSGETGRELERLMARHDEEWRRAAAGMTEPAYTPVVFAAAELLNIDPEKLDWRVEAERGYEPHDPGYEDVVLAEALKLSSRRCLQCPA